MSAVMNICDAELQTLIRLGLVCFFHPPRCNQERHLKHSRESAHSVNTYVCALVSHGHFQYSLVYTNSLQLSLLQEILQCIGDPTQ